MDVLTLILIGTGAGLIIVALITINICLIYRICKKNKHSNKHLHNMPFQKRCGLDQNMQRRTGYGDNTKNKKLKKSVNTKVDLSNNQQDYKTLNTKKKVSEDYEVFDKLQRVRRYSEPLNREYGQIRHTNNSGEYDTACFRNARNDQNVDNMYSRVEKNYVMKETPCNLKDKNSNGTNKSLVTKQLSDSNKETVHRGTIGLSSMKITSNANHGLVSPDTIAVFDNRADGTVALVQNPATTNTMSYENTLTTEYVPTAKPTDYSHQNIRLSLVPTVPFVKNSVGLQTDNSFLKTKIEKLKLRERQSACTQVTDNDFSK